MLEQVNHWCRVVMNRDLLDRVQTMSPAALDALEVSGSVWGGIGFKSYTQAIYPKFDICGHALPESKFDIAIAGQVFEHIPDPDLAAKNIWRSLRPSGAFVISTPFLILYHPSPLDLWRWSAEGLKMMLLRAGFASADTWSWGNRECAIANLGPVFPVYDPAKHSLENDPQFPLVVWGVARK